LALKPYRHWGWACSPYSAKTRAFMRFKGMDFVDESPHLGQMMGRIRRTVGRVVMPVVITPDGALLQDSSAIIDALDPLPGPKAWPQTPQQHCVARLLELYADEWISILAMYTRWVLPNRDFIVRDFGQCAAPWLPGFAQRAVGRKLAERMSAYLPKLGIQPETHAAIEAWLAELLDALDVHLKQHDFLLGGRPCVADFALMGPLYAHVQRDPGSTHLIEARPHVAAWLTRTRTGQATGEFLPEDRIPEGLASILSRCFRDQLPFLADTQAALIAWRAEHPDGTRLPRSMGRAPVRFADATGERTRMTYALWMLQRVLDTLPAARPAIEGWLSEVGGDALLDWPALPRLVFEHYRVRFA
jgi:glutathione S-transferase